jgi:hypothetical protein
MRHGITAKLSKAFENIRLTLSFYNVKISSINKIRSLFVSIK